MKAKPSYGKARPDDGLLPSPRDCMRTRGTGRKCDKCGEKPLILHVPLHQVGTFCSACCPCCAAVLVGDNSATHSPTRAEALSRNKLASLT